MKRTEGYFSNLEWGLLGVGVSVWRTERMEVIGRWPDTGWQGSGRLLAAASLHLVRTLVSSLVCTSAISIVI